MARPLPVNELIPELQFWIKSPTDPSLRKLLRKTIQTLEAFKELVGEMDSTTVLELRGTYAEPQTTENPPLAERIKNGES